MIKSITKGLVIAVVSVLLLPSYALAHDWEDGYCESNNDGYTHTHYYFCYDCGAERSTVESCEWIHSYSDCSNWSNSKHKIEDEYYCPKCGETKTDVTYEYHNYKWIRYGSHFWYECKQCGKAPKYNGYVLTDSNDSDNITIHRFNKYTYFMRNYNKTRNKVKSIKYSKKKICTVTKKGNKLIIKGKKKGKCKVTVKMKSGAKYVLKIKVK